MSTAPFLARPDLAQRLVAGITGVKPKRTVDPDQAVALGAAAFAGILEGEVGEPLKNFGAFVDVLTAVYRAW